MKSFAEELQANYDRNNDSPFSLGSAATVQVAGGRLIDLLFLSDTELEEGHFATKTQEDPTKTSNIGAPKFSSI